LSKRKIHQRLKKKTKLWRWILRKTRFKSNKNFCIQKARKARFLKRPMTHLKWMEKGKSLIEFQIVKEQKTRSRSRRETSLNHINLAKGVKC